MTVAVALGLMGTTLALYVAALSRRFSLAPGWRDQRWFSFAALACAGFCCCNVPIAASTSVAVVVGAARLQVFLGALHLACWVRYTEAVLRERRPAGRWVERAALAAGVAAVIPGVVFRDAYRVRAFAPLGAVYHDPVSTPLGDVVLLALVALFAPLLVQFVRAWRLRVAHAGTHASALAVLLAIAANDVLAAAGVLRTPYLLDVAFVVPVGVVGYVLTSRFSADARALSALRGRLETAVDARTAELARAHQALGRSEKLAALGQFAAGVAHEVNNPTAVVSANLAYLEERLAARALPDDALECVRDARAAAQRIARIVRQLLDAGRLAAAKGGNETVSVAAVAREALRIARARSPDRVALLDLTRPGVHVRGQESMLVQVLVNLVVNGAQAVPEGRAGRVEIAAERSGGRVRITVRDDGAGMAAEVLERVFEPFFSTKPFGVGTGLGLAVSRGLIGSLGGDLCLESEAGRGTVAIVSLPAAEAPQEPAGPARAPPAPPRRRLLVVDDDAALLASLHRLLEARFDLVTADGVAQGLACATEATFDLVLCDVMMPGGGGERLFRELSARAPAQARRLAFLTGGAASEAARAFLAGQPQPVLEKPLDLAALDAVAERLSRGDAQAA
jgi:signal transduction histidine kinase/CheY-like chemotaxis protein